MSQKFQPTEEGIKELFKSIVLKLEEKGLDKYKVNGDIAPSTIFLAGAPGSGKTEFIETIKDNSRFIIIDIDKYRVNFEGYNGLNASDFQNPSTRVANKMYSYCMKNNLNVILDGTFGNLNVIEQNIGLCIKYKRDFGIVLIYQDPSISYFYTKLRQLDGKRNVPKDVFIDKFFNSIENSFIIKQKYKDIFFMFAYKRAKGMFETKKSIVDRKSFDKAIGIKYNKETLSIELNYIDELFINGIKYKKKIISFKSIFLKIFNLIKEKLGLKKKDKKKKKNLEN